MKRLSLVLLALAWGCGGDVSPDNGSTSASGGGAAGAAGSNVGGAGASGKAGAASGAAGQATAGSAGQGAAGAAGQGTAGAAGQGTAGAAGQGTAGAAGQSTAGAAGQGTAGAAGAGACEAAEPLPDPCDCLPTSPAGHYWDGNVCVPLVACCPQMKKGELYKTQDECAAAHKDCASCAPTVIGGDPCDCDPGKTLAWWDGESCQSGSFCCPKASGKLYDSVEACQQEHLACPQVECWTAQECPQPNCPACASNCPIPACVGNKCIELPPGTGCGLVCPPECASGCGYSDKQCGQGQASQVSCLPTPKCGSEFEPVCGCDGVVYQNACQATGAGVDVSQLGNCATPAGYFPCGERFCKGGAEYCQRGVSDIGGQADTYTCLPVPAGCLDPNVAPCECLASEPCGGMCGLDSKGNVTITCPGG